MATDDCSWQRLSVEYMEAGKMKHLRKLIAEKIAGGLSFSQACEPSGYAFKDGKLDCDKSKGTPYTMLRYEL